MGQASLHGQVALVTGGAGSIGSAIGRALDDAGVKVVLADLHGGTAVPGFPEPAVQLDVTDRDAFARVVSGIRERHGSVDILVNNAGVASAGEVHNLRAEDWDRSIDVNLRGAVNGILATYPQMIERRRGWIVNVASLAGLVPVPLLTPYAMAKHGLVGLSTSLRIEAARYGVKVCVACPGPVDTPFLDTEGAGIDARRYLTASAGPAITPTAFGTAVLQGMERNRAVITPGRARVVWGLGRFVPRLAERVLARGLTQELRQASSL